MSRCSGSGCRRCADRKSAADIPFLNDLYRSRADKAGIIYIDVWDGFVDEDGRYAQSGPDFEGQTRRLRAGDGVYFTQAGARKLAHYVEREVQRWMSARAAPVPLPIPEEPKVDARPPRAGRSPRRPASRARPLSGPTVPLIAERRAKPTSCWAAMRRQPATDALVTKVLVKGEAVRAPAGRADDFTWPRRGVAPVGSDPVVATTDLPMTPMVAERRRHRRNSVDRRRRRPSTEVASATAQAASPQPRAARRRDRPMRKRSRCTTAATIRRQWQPQFSFQSLFGGMDGSDDRRTVRLGPRHARRSRKPAGGVSS